jgi:hypothetical protein
MGPRRNVARPTDPPLMPFYPSGHRLDRDIGVRPLVYWRLPVDDHSLVYVGESLTIFVA